MFRPNPIRSQPFSLRLSHQERRSLQARAGGEPLGSYIRSRLFASEESDRRPVSFGSAAVERSELAEILAVLGQSNFARNLDDLVRANRSGSLPLRPDTETSLLAACDDIAEIKSMLMKALGIKED